MLSIIDLFKYTICIPINVTSHADTDLPTIQIQKLNNPLGKTGNI